MHCLVLGRITLCRDFAGLHQLIRFIHNARLFAFHPVHLFCPLWVSPQMSPIVMPALNTWWFPYLCELQPSNESIFLVLPLYFWKVCYVICYICKVKWMKRSLFKMTNLEKLSSAPDYQNQVWDSLNYVSYHFFLI